MVFDEDTKHDEAKEYLEELRANWSNISSSMTKSILTALFLAAIFELLARGAIEEASVQGLKFKDLSLIRNVLPALIAYFYYDLMNLNAITTLYRGAHSTLMKLLYQDIWTNDLEFFLEPPRPSLIGSELPSHGRRNKLIERLYSWQGWLLPLVTGIGIVLFEIYAFYLEFKDFNGASDPIIWVSLISTIFFISYAFVIIVRYTYSLT